MKELSKRLDKGLPKEETQRMSEIRWDHGRGRREKLACAEGEENMIHSREGEGAHNMKVTMMLEYS